MIKKIQNIAEIPVPKGDVIRSESGLEDAVDRFGYPLVIKPIDGNHGRGITTNIQNWEQALNAFHLAKKVSTSVIVEQYITGEDYRILVINHKLVAAARRLPAQVKGDGKSTVQQLIDQTNADPKRGYGHEKVLTYITIDDITRKLLELKNYSLDSIIAKDEILVLKEQCLTN